LYGAALSFVSFFAAAGKESDLPWVNHPLPHMLMLNVGLRKTLSPTYSTIVQLFIFLQSAKQYLKNSITK